ncbi:sensor histidine kinase [Actinoallomurus iriomotensis]|uniref:sensor histidine kinase n=1 Tax=Actinoallomurus iriomotensis TaxID=478107 RepID=UPI002552E333|nr:histidine kinase [Actinoallomurus iriomotensis]
MPGPGAYGEVVSVGGDQAWWRRYPRVVDVAVVLVALFLTLGMMRFAGRPPTRRVLGPVDYGYAAAACAVLLVRRRWPVGVLVVTVLLAVAHGAMREHGPQFLPGQVALYTIAVARGGRAGLVAGAVLLAAAGTTQMVVAPEELSLGAVALVTSTGLAVAAGTGVRTQRAYVATLEERAVRAERARREEAARLVGEERVRIARELHDVVAHQLTLINAQAGVALYLHEGGQGEPAGLVETLSHVKDDSKQALAELRSIVGLLGTPDVPREPVPGLDRLDDLAASFARAGLTVEVRRRGEARAVPSAVDVSGYRIVQEALTNVSKHAATGTARVCLDYAHDTLKIVIADDGAGRGPGGGSGRGLIGMRERAAAVGGEVTAGHRPGGGFLVEAALPLGDQ